jgi:hypothetical protein
MIKTQNTTNGIMTAKDLMNALSKVPADTQVVINHYNELFNIVAIDFPNFESSFAITLSTADTFDPRQF